MADPIVALSIFFGLILILVVLLKVVKLPRLLRSKALKDKTIMEDILKQLYHVESNGGNAGINDISGALELKRKKVLGLIEKATTLNLITSREGYLSLTKAGKEYALKIIRIHRLWEKYLSEKTGISKLDWHPSAEEMEHKLSPEQVETIDSELGNPRFDPHGDPIPTEQGDIGLVNWRPLPSLHTGTTAKIVHIEDEPDVIYRQIIDKKLNIGAQIKVLESNEQVVRIFSEGNEYNFTPIVAANISVAEMRQKELFDERSQRLSELQDGEKGKIIGISSECRGANRRRLLDLGFIRGTEIIPEFYSPMKDPRAYLVRNTLIALRNNQADHILVLKS